MQTGKRLIALLAIVVLTVAVLGACAPHQQRGAAVGGAMGGFTGAIIDNKHPWRGGVIGAIIGGAIGATLADVSARGGIEAARSGEPVEYRTDDGRGVYRAEPIEEPYDGYGNTKCRKVHERTWEDGVLIKDQVREICESEKYERRY